MNIKNYKVVCSQSSFSDDIYIDIAPDQGIIHDQIFFSRILLHKQISTQPLSHLYGSIYLQDDNGEITVTFPPPQARKNSLEYEGIKRRYAELEPKIVKQYKKMRESGRESTLFVYSISEMFELSETRNAEAQAFERRRRLAREALDNKQTEETYKQKHTQKSFPQTPQEEIRQQQKERFYQAAERRIAGEQKRAKEVEPAWRRFQKTYSGD